MADFTGVIRKSQSGSQYTRVRCLCGGEHHDLCLNQYRDVIDTLGSSGGIDLSEILGRCFGRGDTHSIRIGSTLHLEACREPAAEAVAHQRW